MPLLYQMPDDAAGMLVLTFVDAAPEQFVDLAAWHFASEADLSVTMTLLLSYRRHT